MPCQSEFLSWLTMCWSSFHLSWKIGATIHSVDVSCPPRKLLTAKYFDDPSTIKCVALDFSDGALPKEKATSLGCDRGDTWANNWISFLFHSEAAVEIQWFLLDIAGLFWVMSGYICWWRCLSVSAAHWLQILWWLPDTLQSLGDTFLWLAPLGSSFQR